MKLNSELQRVKALIRHPGFKRMPIRVTGRAIRWFFHCLAKVPARARFRRWGFQLFLPPVWKGGGATSPFMFREYYDPELMLLERFLSPGMNMVDGGANTGIYTFVGASLVGERGRVFAFEPGVVCFAALERSRAINHCSHVRLFQAALSDRVSKARLYLHGGHENSFSLGAAGRFDVPYQEVETTTIQEALAACQTNHVNLIKLDIEGAEELALRGCRDLISSSKPVILFEVNPGACARMGLAPSGAMQLLVDLGYRIYFVDERSELVPAAELPESFRNYVAIHE